jgi:hypothetical protein
MSTEVASATIVAPTITEKPIFSEKETKLLTVAMLSLKSGAPDLDMAKFMAGGEFNTMKTAQNTWGVLKKKLIALSPVADEAATGSGLSHVHLPPPMPNSLTIVHHSHRHRHGQGQGHPEEARQVRHRRERHRESLQEGKEDPHPSQDRCTEEGRGRRRCR